MPKKATKQNN